MRHFVLAVFLFFFSGDTSFGQISKAKEIVKKALQKHTSGKVLERYEVGLEYDKPGNIPEDFREPNFLLMRIDSVMPTLPDSTRQQMAIQIKEAKERLYQSSLDFITNRFEYYHLDTRLEKGAYEAYSPNMLKGKTDSSKFVFGANDARYSLMFKINPIVLLQLMSHDSTELNYIGKDIKASEEYEIVQMKWAGKWWEVNFDEKDYSVRSAKEPLIDGNPLIGQQPEYYKNLVTYLNYSKQGEFLLPALVEEMDSRSEFSRRKKLTWKSINQPMLHSVFSTWPSDEELIKFEKFDIGNGLYILEKKNVKFSNLRSLVRKNELGNLDLFTDISNNDIYNEMLKKAIKTEFPGSEISHIFQIQPLHGVASLNCFFLINSKVVAPVGRYFCAENEIRTNLQEDSVWNEAKTKGLIESFDKDFHKNGVTGFIMNPTIKSKYEQHYVCYYLPAEKAIYIEGNPYSARKDSKNANLREKVIYEFMKERKLVVDKIVYSESYLDNAPLFMTFNDFEKRIQNTNFSIYKKWEY